MTRNAKIRLLALAMAALLVSQLGQRPAVAAEPPTASCLTLSVTAESSALVLSAGRCR